MNSLNEFLTGLFSFIIAITIHEFGHAWVATLWGDDTPRRDGRVTLNPMSHLDPLGTAFLAVMLWFGYGFGWGRPVMTHPNSFRSLRKGMFWVAIAGPLMNLGLAIVIAALFRFNIVRFDEGSTYYDLLMSMLRINLVLFLFNLIPVPPLDGSKILSSLLPTENAIAYDRIMNAVGLLPFLLVITCARYFTSAPLEHFTIILLGPQFYYTSS